MTKIKNTKRRPLIVGTTLDEIYKKLKIDRIIVLDFISHLDRLIRLKNIVYKKMRAK